MDQTKSDKSQSGVERGPSGHPYVDIDITTVGKWETGDFSLRVARQDGEMIVANLKPEHLTMLKKAIEHAEENGEAE